MELWFYLTILSIFSFSISTSIDKKLMNSKNNPVGTNTFKMFFDWIFLLVLGLLFYKINFNFNTLLIGFILAIPYSISGIFYFNLVNVENISKSMPILQSLNTILIFILSIVIFNEKTIFFNYIGVFLSIIGIYLIMTENLSLPKIDKGFKLILWITVINLIYYILLKFFIQSQDSINLAISMYFFTALILFVYNQIFLNSKEIYSKLNLKLTFIAALFGGGGTFLLYSAIKLGNASKIYPMLATGVLFTYIIAILFLKEKITFKKMIGVLISTLGIYLIYV